eukprot:TRINITY_DN3960_c0_g2_i2.p1 TRINITY_DN3960_c0_g2~~TRINITY_DN3960_c0_g2_i2.p1  ORF type:complete len:358 (-),score=26.03 TRINITY_DN3960_c0_g2_i2:23-1066(-)
MKKKESPSVYSPLNTNTSTTKTSKESNITIDRQPYVPSIGNGLYYKMRYFNALSVNSELRTLVPPAHIVPKNLWLGLALQKPKQKSLVTIFSLWNTMMGSSLLTLPWGFSESGLIMGIITLLVVGVLTWYTCTLIVKHGLNRPDGSNVELFDLCKEHFGKVGEILPWFASILVLVGALVAYDILMMDSLYSNVQSVIYWSTGHNSSQIWTKGFSAAIVIAVVFPIANLKSFSILVKFNSVGILCIALIVIFILVSSFKHGLKFDNVPLYNTGFIHLAGLLNVSFFIHNCVVAIMKDQENPKKNVRDLTIAFILAGLTYCIIGAITYLAYWYYPFANGIPQDLSLIHI